MLGSSPTEQQKINLPAYQRYGLEQQRGLYDKLSTTPTYTKPPVVPMTESQQTAQRLGTGYAFGDRPLGMQHGAENTLMNMMSGQIDTGAGTPWDAARQARRSRAVRGLTEDILPGIRQGITQYQPGGGSEGNQIQALAIARQQETLDEQDKQMELEAMRMGQQRQTQALGAYPGIMGAPQQFYAGAQQAAAPEYNVQQAMRTADKAAYDQRRQQAIEAMSGYTKGIGDISGGFGDISKLKDLGLLTYK
jgi:hypothetical protein